LYLYVDDVDEVASRARLQGGNIAQHPEDMFWGDRCAIVVDTDGHCWMLATHVKDIAFEDMVMPETPEA
jgi:PhnB protein